MNRYYRARSEQDKQFNLNNARTNFDYMVSHASPTYILMPEVHRLLGTVFLLSGRPGQAIAEFTKSIELDPHQPKAYQELSDYYLGLKQQKKALEVVTEGLRYNPDAKVLQRRYEDLGGKLPYPEAVVREAPQSATRTETSDTGSRPMPEQPVAQQVQEISPARQKTDEAIKGIGSPKNPYCRFCPE
jgi:tetratricopeptide (TPR) repeat protein